MSLTPRENLIEEVKAMLGHPVIDLELTDRQWNLALDLALSRYRYQSSNSHEERYTFLELQPEQSDYYLPLDVIEVRGIFRRSMSGTASQSGAVVDPFGAAFTNQFLLSGVTSNQMDLVTFELLHQYKDQIGRMFGFHITYYFNASSKRLTIDRYIRAPETVLLWLYIQKPEEMLLADPWAGTWLRNYTTAKAKYMIGEIRSKYSSLGGPQGGTTLNGDSMKTEASATIEQLENELKNNMDAYGGYGFILG